MRNIFLKAHKLTREIKAQYPDVDYRTQFGLNLSYLLNKEEEEEVLDSKIKDELVNVGATEEEIRDTTKLFEQYNRINKEYIGSLYDNSSVRRAMKARGLWNDKDFGLDLSERYLGTGFVETKNEKVWANYGKIRIYFDIVIDNDIISKNHYITVR